MRIDTVHVVFTRQRSDRLDRSSRFRRKVCRSSVDLFQLLVLQHDHLEAQVTARDEQRHTCDTDGSEFCHVSLIPMAAGGQAYP